jgi:hypothetical protein
MALDDRTFYFTSTATIRQLLEILVNEANVPKGQRKEKKPVELQRDFSTNLYCSTFIYLTSPYNLLKIRFSGK